MLKGLAETEEDLREKRIPFHLLQAAEPRGGFSGVGYFGEVRRPPSLVFDAVVSSVDVGSLSHPILS